MIAIIQGGVEIRVQRGHGGRRQKVSGCASRGTHICRPIVDDERSVDHDYAIANIDPSSIL